MVQYADDFETFNVRAQEYKFVEECEKQNLAINSEKSCVMVMSVNNRTLNVKIKNSQDDRIGNKTTVPWDHYRPVLNLWSSYQTSAGESSGEIVHAESS